MGIVSLVALPFSHLEQLLPIPTWRHRNSMYCVCMYSKNIFAPRRSAWVASLAHPRKKGARRRKRLPTHPPHIKTLHSTASWPIRGGLPPRCPCAPQRPLHEGGPPTATSLQCRACVQYCSTATHSPPHTKNLTMVKGGAEILNRKKRSLCVPLNLLQASGFSRRRSS